MAALTIGFVQTVFLKIIISWFSGFPSFLEMLGFIVFKRGLFSSVHLVVRVVSVVLVASS